MNLEYFWKGIHCTDHELVLLAKKIGRLATYCERLKNEGSVIRVEAEKRDTKKADDQVKVMLTVELPRKEFRAESRREYILDAVDRCIEKLEPGLKKYKELHTGRGRAHVSEQRRQKSKRRSSRAA